MPPIPEGESLSSVINRLITENRVMVFSKTTCPFCAKVKELFSSMNVPFRPLELDKEEYGPDMQNALQERTGSRTVPQVFINGDFIGGCDDTIAANSNGSLKSMLFTDEEYDYDLVVIGGGSGGLAASKESALLGKKVAVCDFVVPTPTGTTWGLGGTCVNVGCIPKKLFHQAALLGVSIEDARKFGWDMSDTAHRWTVLREAVQNYIGSLNWNYRVQLREKKVTYLNAFAEFVGPHEIKITDKKGKQSNIKSRQFLLATGERPKYPDIPGASEYAVTSDDIFSLPYCPGKTLVVGASYVALECAGFLRGFGLDVTVMVRSILLRGFDQEMAEKIGAYMENEGIKFIRPCIPIKIEQIESGKPGLLRVTGQTEIGEKIVDEYNMVLLAIGREACTKGIGLEHTGVNVNEKNGKIPVVNEQTNIPHIFAIGDILDGKPELTPVAIEAGILLARRLYGESDIQCDYINVPTTVFTPIEYGCVGYSEEAAIKQFGEDDVEIYHTSFTPLEWVLPKRGESAGYVKLICLISKAEKVIGFHYLGPNAGEVTQGFAVAIKKGATKADFDATIGIHPTCAELFTTLEVTKRSGGNILQKGC